MPDAARTPEYEEAWQEAKRLAGGVDDPSDWLRVVMERLDVYSLPDAVKAAKARGYEVYEWIRSDAFNSRMGLYLYLHRLLSLPDEQWPPQFRGASRDVLNQWRKEATAWL